MYTRTETLQACHTGNSLDRMKKEEVEKKVAEAFEEAQEREKWKLNISGQTYMKVQRWHQRKDRRRTLQWSGS